MPVKMKITVACLALVAAGLLAYDASAGNLASTPSTEYFYVTLQVDEYLQWSGAGSAMVLIDDVVFTGVPEPESPGELVESFFDVMGAPEGSDDLGSKVEFNNNANQVWTAGGSPVGGGTLYTSSSSSSAGSTTVFLANRQWDHALELRDTASSPLMNFLIDRFTLTGHAAVQIRETTMSSEFKEKMLFRTWGTEGMQGTSVGGAGGAGVGVGTGVGGIGWLTETSSARHYQTPYMMGGSAIYLRDTNLPGGEAIIHGRVIRDSNEWPTRSTGVTVHSQ